MGVLESVVGFFTAISFQSILDVFMMMIFILVPLCLAVIVLKMLYNGRSLLTIQLPRDGVQMWGFVAIPQGEHWNVYATTGQRSTVVGPKVIGLCGSKLAKLKAVQATQAEYLRLDYMDGHSEILPGPSVVHMDPAVHKSVRAQPAILLNEHEVLVVYREEEEAARKGEGEAEAGGKKRFDTKRVVKRYVIHGPCLHMPENATEWVHKFSWHGSDPNSDSYARKIKCGLKFEKLRTCPDQTYYDVENVRTKDDALLTIKLMIFFRLKDIDTMLRETHDPIADFVNAVSSDVIEFVSGKSFEEFKASTEEMNNLNVYNQLKSRASGIGYDVTKVVFRGYGAPQRLQKMHDDAIEKRTKLVLERETEEQEQQLEDLRIQRDGERLQQKQRMETSTKEHERQLKKAAHGANQKELLEERTAQLQHLAHLKTELGMSGAHLAEYLIAVERGAPSKLIQITGAGSGGNGTPPFVHIQDA